MRYFSSILLLASCSYNDDLHPTCGNIRPGECYAVPGVSENLPKDWPIDLVRYYQSKAGIGECKTGKPTCDENYNVIKCEGEGPLPMDYEICDDLDNDCNNIVDDRISSLDPYYFEPGDHGLEVYPCVCEHSYAYCDDGIWECYEEPTEEVCNGWDDDCDGSIDEHVLDDWTMQERVCYSGNPEWTYANLPCRTGVFQCVYGNIECVGEITPSSEQCNNIDDDCDGEIDDGLEFAASRLIGDFIYDFDTSGSMGGTINSVKTATGSFSSQYQNDERYKFGIVDAAASINYVSLRQNLTDFNTFQIALNNINANGSGSESVPESIYMICHRDNPLNINWTIGNPKAVFVFTDEPAQIYQNTWLTDIDIINTCLETSTRVFIWSNNRPDFEPIAVFSGGLHFDLINDSIVIENDLNSIMLSSCQNE